MKFKLKLKRKKPGKKFSLKEFINGINRKTLKNGSYSVAITAVVIAGVVLVNLIIGEIPASARQIDVTEQQLYTITEDTETLLDGLEEEVTIYHVVESGNEDETITKLLERYEDASSNITVDEIDPVLHPNFTSEYTDSDVEDNSLIVVCGDKNRIVNYSDMYEYEMDYYTYSYSMTGFDGEGQLTSAINYVTTENMPVIYTLEGHNEQSLGSSLTELIEKSNIEIQSLNLLTSESVPEDAQCLIINSPASDISEDERDKILEYLENGGKAMIFSDYTTEDMTNFDSLLENYGVMREDGIVIEGDNQHYAAGMPYYLIPTVEYTEICQEAYSSGKYVLVPMAQGITTLENVRDTLTVEELLTTSDSAYSKVDIQSQTLEQEEEDISGSFALGVYITETVDSETQTQVAYFSSSFLAQDEVDQMVSGGNSEMLMEVLSYMCGTEDVETVSIPSKSLSVSYLTWTESSASFWKIVTIGVIPAVFLLSGFCVWYKRRRQ